MDILEYTEAVAAKSLDVARAAYDDLHERAYKLATVLVAGGGAVGAYALGKVGTDASLLTWAPLAALSLSWFGSAAVLVVGGATSRELSPGNGPNNLRDYFAARIAEVGGDADAALIITRNAELDRVQVRLKAYTAGCIARATAIDRAYWSIAAFSPLVPIIVAIFCVWQS